MGWVVYWILGNALPWYLKIQGGLGVPMALDFKG